MNDGAPARGALFVSGLGQPSLGRPAVQVVPVEQLPPVDEVAQPAPVARPAERETRRDRAAPRSIRVGGDERRPLASGVRERIPRAGASAGSHGSSLRLTWSVTQRTSKPLRPYRSTSSATVNAPSLHRVCAWSSRRSGSILRRIVNRSVARSDG